MNIAVITQISLHPFIPYLDQDGRSECSKVEKCGHAPAVEILIEGLLNENHQITIFSFAANIEKDYFFHGKNLKIYFAPLPQRWPIGNVFTYSNAMVKFIKQTGGEFDIIHAHWTYFYALAAARFCKDIPVVITVRDWAPNVLKLTPFPYNLSRLQWSFLDWRVFHTPGLEFIANSPYIANLIAKNTGLAVPVIPNPIRPNTAIMERRSYPDEFKIISISVGINRLKNIEPLLLAFKSFHTRHHNSILQLIGADFVIDHPAIVNWQKQDLTVGVELKGKLNHADLTSVLDDSSVLVHPSLEESFGNTLIEGMARRIPVIGGVNSGAVPFVLEHGNAGCLCDVRFPDAIEAALEKIYSDSEYRDKIIERATQLIYSRYSLSEVVFNTLKLYRQLITRHRNASGNMPTCI